MPHAHTVEVVCSIRFAKFVIDYILNVATLSAFCTEYIYTKIYAHCY